MRASDAAPLKAMEQLERFLPGHQTAVASIKRSIKLAWVYEGSN